MKKYIIKNADGSEQSVMQAVHLSYKDAGETLKEYLFKNKEDLNADDYLSPFDFALEEVECKEVNETITDLESARKSLGLRPLKGISEVRTAFAFPDKIPEDILIFLNEFNPHHLNALIALNELFTLAEAWNKEDGFVPDFSDRTQDKWFPWFVYDKDAAGFVFVHTDLAPTVAYAYFGSRLCFKSSERAEQFGRQFADLYNKVFL